MSRAHDAALARDDDLSADAVGGRSFPLTLPLVVACGLFMQALDMTIVAVALPVIGQDLGVPPATLGIALACYPLGLAIFIPISGWMADRYGTRLVFASSIAAFTVASLFCGLAQSLPQLVIARLLQGAGGAMMLPVGRLALLRSVAKADYVRAMSWVTVPALLGPAIGPLIGGLIVGHLSWRWIFYVNLPVGILGAIAAWRALPNLYGEAPRPFDRTGFLLGGFGLAGLVLGLETLGHGTVPGAWPALVLLLPATLLVLYIRHARRTAAPLLDLELFRIRSFRTAVLGGLVCRMGFGAVPFLIPLLLQLGFGMTPLKAGAVTAAVGVGAVTMKTVATRMVRAFGFRALLVGNGIVVGVAIMGFAFVGQGTPLLVLVAALTLFGFMRSLQFTCLNALGFADLTGATMSHGTGLLGTAQQLSVSLGVAIGGVLLCWSMAIDGSTVPEPSDFRIVFIAIGLLPILSTWMFWRLPADAGASVSGHHGRRDGDAAVRRPELADDSAA